MSNALQDAEKIFAALSPARRLIMIEGKGSDRKRFTVALGLVADGAIAFDVYVGSSRNKPRTAQVNPATTADLATILDGATNLKVW